MAEAKFRVGDRVRIVSNRAINPAEALLDKLSPASTVGQASGVWEVTACLPATAGQFQYRVKGSATPPERIVFESQLVPATAPQPRA
jgi:hypothetical protein